jgi:nitrite reductase (NADH) small subunit
MSEIATVAWVDVGSLDDLPPQAVQRIETPRGPIALFRTIEGGVFALADRCPHEGGPLSEGIVHGRAVTCPLHSWVIDLESGEPKGGDAGKGCARIFGVRVERDRILLAWRG